MMGLGTDTQKKNKIEFGIKGVNQTQLLEGLETSKDHGGGGGNGSMSLGIWEEFEVQVLGMRGSVEDE